MRRSNRWLVAAGLAVAILCLSGQAQACEQCQKKLRCIGDECWTEYVCVGNLRYPQRGFPGCDSYNWGCEYSGQICQWTRLLETDEPLPFLIQIQAPTCTSS